MVKSIGVDIISNARMKNKIDDQTFLKRILSLKELEIFSNITNLNRKIEYLASRFASKEAIFKCLPVGDGTLNYSDISILNDDFGKPYIELHNSIRSDMLLSLSHEKENSIAFVIWEE